MQARVSISLLLMTMLVACGFQLRGDVNMPAEMQKTWIEYRGTDRNFQRAVVRALDLSGVEVVQSRESATAVLRLIAAPVTRRVLARDERGRPQEYELTVGVRFAVTSPEGHVFVTTQEVQRRNNLLLDPTDPLTNQGDISYLVGTMRDDSIWEMLRRIAATDFPPVPETPATE